MKSLFKKIIVFMILCCSLIFCCNTQAEAKGKYDASLYQDVLNYPACYSGKVQFERVSETADGEKVTLTDNESLKYIIKDVTGDGIKELFVMDSQHLFIFTQKYNKKTKSMKVSVMTVLRLVDPPTICFRKSGNKRYLCIDYGYAGTGITTKLIYQGKGTKLTLKNKLLYSGNWQGDTDESWSVNGKIITKKKYNSYVKKYFVKKYKLKYKTKKLSEKSIPQKMVTLGDKIAPSVLILGGYYDKDVWNTHAKTFMASYALTEGAGGKKKAKLTAVKKEMKNLFGTNKVKFSKSAPYNLIKKKGKWVKTQLSDWADETPFCDIVDVYSIGKNLYRAKYISYSQNLYDQYSTDRLHLKTYYVTFKKSSGKYGYIIKDIREIKELTQTDTNSLTVAMRNVHVVGDQYTPIVFDADLNPIYDCVWKSQNTNIVTIDAYGNMNFVGAGKTTVTMTYQSQTYKYDIYVGNNNPENYTYSIQSDAEYIMLYRTEDICYENPYQISFIPQGNYPSSAKMVVYNSGLLDPLTIKGDWEYTTGGHLLEVYPSSTSPLTEGKLTAILYNPTTFEIYAIKQIPTYVY